MAKAKGKSAVVITVLSNPAVRRAVIKGATKAAGSAAAFAASRAEKSKAPAAATAPEQRETTVMPAPAATRTVSMGETVAVESIVTSVAKPLADRLAASSAGRSVLETINSISGQALGAAAPRRGGAAVAGFVGSILSGQGAQKPSPAGDQASVKFTPVKPPTTPPPPVPTMQWPPPRSSEG